ncbi:hypothetical protein V8C44DRAFT_314925 [Trichoderma aethiopicum]
MDSLPTVNPSVDLPARFNQFHAKLPSPVNPLGTAQRLGGGAITTNCRDGVGVFNGVKSSGGKSPLGLARLGDSGGAGWLATANDGEGTYLGLL